MAKLVVHGAQLRCSEGSSPGGLVVPRSSATGEDAPAATVLDHVAMLNVPSFGVCKTLANPQVASATAAAQGVLTPMPCVPVLSAPWVPGAAVATIDGVAVVTDGCKCSCAYSGVIEVLSSGSFVDVE